MRTRLVLSGWVAACVVSTNAVSAQAGTMSVNLPFTGDSTTNWGWGSKTDTNGQLSGVDHLTYAYAATNGKSYVFNSVTDGAPEGTGTNTIHLKLDLTNYRTAAADYNRPTYVEITTGGNKSAFTGGKIAGLMFGGYTNAGQYQFLTSTAMLYAGGPLTFTGAYTLGTSPTFPLVYDVTWTVSITGSDAAGWTIASSATLQGPTNSSGSIGTITIPTSTYTATNTSFNGWGSVTGYIVGDSGQGNTIAGNAITLDAFSATGIPEPAGVALLASGLWLAARRRRA